MFVKIAQRIGSISRIKFYYQRSIEDYSKREKISNKIARRIGKSEFKGNSVIDHIAVENTLHNKGYINFGKVLDTSQVEKIKNALSGLKFHDPFRPHLGYFTENNIPKEVHVANYTREDLIKIPEILSLANDPKILSLAQEFLGATPTISNINCWWSITDKREAEQAQLFHRDVDDYRFCKIFVYLTDVGIDDGPHVFVEDSPATNTLTKIRRYQDEEVENEFGKDKVKYFTGEKGSMFMVNTYGFHKGLLPKSNNRLLLQFQYSLQPIAIEKYEPVKIEKQNYHPFVNRLLIK